MGVTNIFFWRGAFPNYLMNSHCGTVAKFKRDNYINVICLSFSSGWLCQKLEKYVNKPACLDCLQFINVTMITDTPAEWTRVYRVLFYVVGLGLIPLGGLCTSKATGIFCRTN